MNPNSEVYGRQITLTERHAYSVQADYYEAKGISEKGLSSVYTVKREISRSDINLRAYTSCIEDFNGRDASACTLPNLP